MKKEDKDIEIHFENGHVAAKTKAKQQYFTYRRARYARKEKNQGR